MKLSHAHIVPAALSVTGFALAVGSALIVIAPQWRDHNVRHGWGGRICDRFRPSTGFGNDSGEDMHLEMCAVSREAGGIRVTGWKTLFGPDEGLFEALRSEHPAYLASLGESFRDVGSWAATNRQYGVYFILEAQVAGEELPLLRRAVVEAAKVRQFESLDRAGADVIKTGEWSGDGVLWQGYALNGATIIGLGMWVIPIPFVVGDLRRVRRVRTGRCWKCGYDLRGLSAGASACPECGTTSAMVSAQKDTD